MYKEKSFTILNSFETTITSSTGDVMLLHQEAMQPCNYGIPEISFEPNLKSLNSMELNIEDAQKVSFRRKSWGLVLKFPYSLLRGSMSIPYVGLTLNEYQRQVSGHSLLTHGASVLDNYDSRAILILGNQYAGKTTLLTHLCKSQSNRFSLIGNDQVYIGTENSQPIVLGGTKFLLVRETARKMLLPDSSSFTKEKLHIEDPSLMGINLAPSHTYEIKSILLPKLREECTNHKTRIEKLTNIFDFTLFFAEKISRHITGICSPIFLKNGEIFLGANLENAKTRFFREQIIRMYNKLPIYKIEGSSVSDITESLTKIL